MTVPYICPASTICGHFYYGDPYFPPEEPIKGLLSKEYAKQRAALIKENANDPGIIPGDPYSFEGKSNPYTELLKKWKTTGEGNRNFLPAHDSTGTSFNDPEYMERMWMGTTTIEAADKEGWVVSITPSGGWLPACIAGNTGIGMSQRLQSFVLDASINPFNVIAPGKRPRVTLTPTMALKDG